MVVKMVAKGFTASAVVGELQSHLGMKYVFKTRISTGAAKIQLTKGWWWVRAC
jgi:hypothetical protein